MRQLGQYLFSNVGTKLNYSRLAAMLGIKSPNTVKSYIEYIQTSFLGFLINKFDYSVKKQLIGEKKFYAIDSGIIDKVSTKIVSDKGWIIENIVFLELKRRYPRDAIYYLENGSECDFILVSSHSGKNIKEAIQVTYQLSEKNQQREVQGLVEALKKVSLKRGLILTYSQNQQIEFDEGYSISVEPVWKWLLSR